MPSDHTLPSVGERCRGGGPGSSLGGGVQWQRPRRQQQKQRRRRRQRERRRRRSKQAQQALARAHCPGGNGHLASPAARRRTPAGLSCALFAPHALLARPPDSGTARCGQRSSRHPQAPSAARQITSCFPSSSKGCGLDASRSLTAHTAYHCLLHAPLQPATAALSWAAGVELAAVAVALAGGGACAGAVQGIHRSMELLG